MNLKAKCAVCKGNLVKGEQTTKLMIGPQGYRSYALCLRCAGKVEKKAVVGGRLTVTKAGV